MTVHYDVEIWHFSQYVAMSVAYQTATFTLNLEIKLCQDAVNCSIRTNGKKILSAVVMALTSILCAAELEKRCISVKS